MSRAPSTTLSTGPGARKAAIVLIQLGRERASQVLNHLSEADVEAVTAEIARLESIGHAESEQVLNEFRELLIERVSTAQGGVGFAQQLLQESLGHDRAAEIIDRLTVSTVQLPFQFLHRADPEQLRSFIADEHPQVIALVLAHMPPEKASGVLAGLTAEQQSDIAHRIAIMDRTSPGIIRAVEGTLKRKLSSMLQPAEMSRVGGVDSLVNIINRSDRATEKQIVEGLQELDPTLAEEVRSRMFLFDDIIELDDRSVQQVLRMVDANDLAVALKGASESVRDKVIANLSERASVNLMEEVELLGAVRLRQVEEARQRIIRTIRQLEEEGTIIVRRGSDDEFVS